MATIEHENIADPYIHEPKDVSTASADEVYVADGAGSGAWSKLPITALEGISSNGADQTHVVGDGAGGFKLQQYTHGMCYFSNTGTPYTWTYSATYTKIAPTTTTDGSPVQITEGTDAKLTYTGTVARAAHILAVLSVQQAAGANRDLQFALYKNGSILADSVIIVTSVTGEWNCVSIVGNATLAQNDYIEVYMKNNGASGNVSVGTFKLDIEAP